MKDDQRRVLLFLPQKIVDRARVLAGEAMITLKLPVSLQIVFRVLIEHGLKRGGDRALLAGVASEATAIHQRRRSHADRTPAERRPANRRAQPTARKWERGRNDSMLKWMAVTTWATIAAVTLGCAHPDPALTTSAAPASASVAPAEASENATVGDETDHATAATRLKAAAFYLYLLARSQ